jgi:DNA primase
VLYDQYFIDDLKDRADLVRIIEPYARDLKKKGANWMACCPFHQEKTPSFSVNPQKGFYKCFGCGKGGNAYTFLMEMEGLNFPEAIQRVAEMAGVPLPEPIDDGQYHQNKKRKEEKKQLSEQVIELNKIALEFWEAELQSKDKKAKAAREYLEQRGISEEIQKHFRIGFSPDSWQALHDHLLEKGADEKIIEQSGLVSVNEEKDRVFDRFRGRIMFPVLDVNGNPIAFGARAMGDDQPKYLNSPETPAYVKGQHLYGLFQSKEAIRQKKFAILVEGYLDLIALYQFGITNVAASLGTAFTPEQSKLLSRFTKKVVINYDGDSAGIKAARRAIDELLPQDFEIKVLVLPDGQDPDDFIRANGADGYNAARGHATPYLFFTFDASMRGRSLANPRHKAEAIEDVVPVLSAIRNPIQKRESFDQAMDYFRVDDTGLKRDLWRTVKNGSQASPDAIRREVKRVAQAKITVAEQHLLELLVHDAELRTMVLPILEESDYESLATAAIFRAIYAIDERGDELDLGALLDATSEDEVAADLVPLLMIGEPKRHEGEVLDTVFHDAENCILSLRSMAIQNRIQEVSQELLAAEQSGNTALVNSLVGEQLDLSKMKQVLLSKLKET